MEFSPTLKRKYENADLATRELFETLIRESSSYCINHTSVEMKEFHYRLQKLYKASRGRKYQNFCLYTLTPVKRGVTVHLRTEDMKLVSDTIRIDYIGQCSYLRGKGWVKFEVRNILDVDEAVTLIKRIYES